MVPPSSPITAQSYAAAGLPFFSLPDEPKGGIYGMFSDIKSIMEIDAEKGKKGLDKELKFRTIKLDKTGKIEFRSVQMMEANLNGMHFAHFQ